MNHKQKLGYMALGAGILALGIIIGQFVTPDIKAQSNGVFDKITCREIEVIDKDSKTGIMLTTHERGGLFVLSGKAGSVDIGTTVRGGVVSVSGKDGGSARMMTYKHGGRVEAYGKDGGRTEMGTDGFGEQHVYVSGKDGGRVDIGPDEHGGHVQVYGKGLFDSRIAGMGIAEQSGVVWVLSGKDYGSARMITDEHGGHVQVLNNQLEIRAAMGVNEDGNGALSTWDRNGYRQ